MSAIDTIEAKLAAYPAIKSVLNGDATTRTITVLPSTEDGFAVSLTESPNHWTVGYEGWHEEFNREDVALECFGFGLSSACRLRVEYRGETPVKWTVEGLSDGGEWVEDSTTGLLHPFFWRRQTRRYKQNQLLPVDPVWLHSARAT